MKSSPVIPILRVKDARASERFYCDVLEFTKQWEHQFAPGYPLMMSVKREAMELFLSEHQGTGTDAADLYVYVENLEMFHRALVAKGARIEQPPTNQPWGVRDMQIRDVDGHRFTFGARSEPHA